MSGGAGERGVVPDDAAPLGGSQNARRGPPKDRLKRLRHATLAAEMEARNVATPRHSVKDVPMQCHA